MAGYTTIFPTSAKGEYPACLHNFNGSVTPTGTVTSGSQHVTAISSMAGIGLGSSLAATGVPAGSFVADIDSTTSLYFGGAGNATATNAGTTLTIAGHVFKIALGVSAPVGTFGAATTNYSQLGSDEVANGNGYTTGGVTLTANITPATGSGEAYWQWTNNPSWTSATFSTGGCLIYNTSQTNRVVYVGNIGTQSVTGGTITLLQPASNGPGLSLLQLN